MDLSITPLRTFVTIVDTGSYTRAAEQLFLSQPALSLQIKRLEEQLGQQLLARRGRQTVVTDAGNVLLSYAKQILTLNEEAIARLSVADTEGRVRVGVLEEVAVGPLVDLLTMFGRLCSKVQIDFEIDTSYRLSKRIQDNSLELAVLNKSFAGKDVIDLWEEEYLWVEQRGSDHHKRTPLKLIMDTPDTPCAIRDAAMLELERARLRTETVFSSTSILAIQAAVLAGLGIGMLSPGSVSGEMRVLGATEGMPEVPRAQIVLARSVDAKSNAVDTLASFLVSHLQAEMAPH